MREDRRNMRKPLSIIAYVLVGILLLGVAYAGVKGSNTPTSNLQSPTTKWDLGQKDLNPIVSTDNGAKDEPIYVTVLSFIFKLAVVVALAYGTIYALKRFNVGSLQRSNTHQIKVVENTTLGANRSLHLVDVGAKRLLVASTPTQISLITEMQVDDVPPAMIPGGIEHRVDNDQAIKPSNGQTFGDQLSSFLGAKLNNADVSTNVARTIRSSSTFLQEKIMELGRLRRNLRDA